MSQVTVFTVVLFCSSVVLSSWAQEADVAEPGGFASVAQLDGFEPTGRPAVVGGQRLVVPGMLHREDDDGPERVAVLWRVESGEIEVMAPPVDAQGQAMTWRGLTCINAQGQLIGHVQPSAEDFNPLNWDSYLRQADGEFVLVVAIPRGINDVDAYGAVALDIDDQGKVLGERYRRHFHGGGDSFIWSVEEGMQMYDDPPDWHRMSVNAISPGGVVVGVAGDSAGGWSQSRPVIYFAPDDILVLDAPEGTQFSKAMAINAGGQVLVVANDIDLLSTEADGIIWRTKYYFGVWDADEGLVSLPAPNHTFLQTKGFSDSAEVLFWGRDTVRHGANRMLADGGFGYICRDGVLYRLPEYPGALERQTYYTAMCSQGNIVGYAVIPVEGVEDATRVVGFVLSPDIELEPVGIGG